jgi:anti-sigma-K factor RskA
MRCSQTVESGAYVLGALAPAERAAYERHLSSCAICRNEVAQAAGLPGLLRRLDAGTAEAIGRPETAPPALLEKLLIKAQSGRLRDRRQRHWRRAGALLAAACLAILVGVGATALASTAETSKPVVAALTPVDADEPVAAMVSYWADPEDGGTDISMACVYPDTSTHYHGVAHLDLWVFPRDGGPGRSVWSWDAGPGDRVSFWAESSLRPDQIGRLEIRRGPTALLVYRAT